MSPSFPLFIVLLLTSAAAKAAECDESLKGEVVALFENCFGSYKRDLEAVAEKEVVEFGLEGGESCRLVDRYMQCSNILSICSEGDDESRKAIDGMMRENLMSIFADGGRDVANCLELIADDGRRPKRSPGKQGKTGGSRLSTAKKVVKTLLDNRKAAKKLLDNRKAAKKLLGNRKAAAGTLKSGGGSSGKSKLKKYGKYAVAGVAAYGAYKLAKKMVKGHRGLYDDDDCWEHEFLTDRYRCVCPSRCNVYGGASTAHKSALGFGSLLCFSTLVANGFLKGLLR